MTLAKGHGSVVCQHFQREFSSGTTGPISFKYHMQPSSKVGKKLYIFGIGHLTMIAAMPIYVKTLKNLLLQNHWADCLETW